MKKLWKLSPPNKELQESLSRELDVLPVIAQLLINRGLVDCDKAFSFLSPDLRSLHDPFLMKDMDRAVKRIATAIREREKIAIYGDYDVDGVSASALLYLFFKELGVDVLTCIPDRKTEGYGLNVEAIKRLASSASGGGGAKLVITVDCGTSNAEEIRFASSIGIDCIVTDHHLPPPEADGVPPAYAIVNPMQKDCLFPFKGLSGVGVAFNLLMALRSELKKDSSFASPNLKKYLDLVCVGTIADMVPLVDENRIFVSFGLKELSSSARPGIIALKEVSGINTVEVTAENIAFQFAPRLNAAGRLAHADTALRLLITESLDEARLLAKKLNSENISRQGVEARILNEALELAGDGGTDRALVLASDNWHAGVVGIVAGRLAERLAKPVALIALDGDIGKGSVRGVKGCNVVDGLKSASRFLERYGGHKAAAGLTVRRDNLDDFRAAFVAYMNSNLSDDDLTSEVELDCMVSFDELNLRLLGEIKRLEPFGQANEKPLFCAVGADILNTEVVKEKHLRIKLRQNGMVQNAMAFRMAGLHPIKGDSFDVAFYPYVDEWRGVQSVRLNVKDIKPSGV